MVRLPSNKHAPPPLWLTLTCLSRAAGPGQSSVAPTVWIYFAITIPLTLAILLFWRWWDKSRERQYAEEDMDLEAGIDRMEAQIMATMRKRTLSKVRTWGTMPASTG